MAQKTYGICLRMKLCADHFGRKADGHDGALIGHMVSDFFQGNDLAPDLPDALVVWLDHLVVSGVDGPKWVCKSLEKRIICPGLSLVDCHDPKRSGFSFVDLREAKMLHRHLKGVADKQHVLLLFLLQVPVPNGIEQAEEFFVPNTISLQGVTWPAGADIQVVVFQIGYFGILPNVKDLQGKLLWEPAHDIVDTAHSLIGFAVVHVQHGYFYFLLHDFEFGWGRKLDDFPKTVPHHFILRRRLCPQAGLYAFGKFPYNEIDYLGKIVVVVFKDLQLLVGTGSVFQDLMHEIDLFPAAQFIDYVIYKFE